MIVVFLVDSPSRLAVSNSSEIPLTRSHLSVEGLSLLGKENGISPVLRSLESLSKFPRKEVFLRNLKSLPSTSSEHLVGDVLRHSILELPLYIVDNVFLVERKPGLAGQFLQL